MNFFLGKSVKIMEMYFLIPVGVWFQNDVVSTSMRRDDINTTSFLRRMPASILYTDQQS